MVARTHAVNTRIENNNIGKKSISKLGKRRADPSNRATSSNWIRRHEYPSRRGRQDRKYNSTSMAEKRVSLILRSVQLVPPACTTERSAVSGGRGNQGGTEEERTERKRRGPSSREETELVDRRRDVVGVCRGVLTNRVKRSQK